MDESNLSTCYHIYRWISIHMTHVAAAGVVPFVSAFAALPTDREKMPISMEFFHLF